MIINTIIIISIIASLNDYIDQCVEAMRKIFSDCGDSR